MRLTSEIDRKDYYLNCEVFTRPSSKAVIPDNKKLPYRTGMGAFIIIQNHQRSIPAVSDIPE